MDDNERFKNCRPLEINCTKCQEKVRVLSVMEGDQRILTLSCSNCQAMYFGKGYLFNIKLEFLVFNFLF